MIHLTGTPEYNSIFLIKDVKNCTFFKKYQIKSYIPSDTYEINGITHINMNENVLINNDLEESVALPSAYFIRSSQLKEYINIIKKKERKKKLNEINVIRKI